MRAQITCLALALLLCTACRWSPEPLQETDLVTSFLTGSSTDVVVETRPGWLLLGGGGDVDAAMRWFLERANGGDVVILRASGGDGYHRYFFEELGVPLNSVRTFVFHGPADNPAPALLAALDGAEAIFIAGGDQARYMRFWAGTPVQAALQRHVDRGRPIGGTSAGLAVLGRFAYAALHEGDLTSAIALEDPHHPYITLTPGLVEHPFLERVLTDSHFSERDRLGRLLTMLRRLQADEGATDIVGLGVDEATALCIDENGVGRVFSSKDGRVYLVFPESATGSLPRNAPLTTGPATVVALDEASVLRLPGFEVEEPAERFRIEAAKGHLRRLAFSDTPPP